MIPRFLPVFLLLGGLVRADSTTAHKWPEGGMEGLWRTLSPELRRMEQRVGDIEEELKTLPPLSKETWGSRYGHRSADLASEDQADWLQVDLGERQRVDTLVLMPAYLSYRGREGEGYGFPKRFRVEFSDDPEMRDAVTLVDRSGADVPNPGRYPMVFKVDPKQGRYLRFTSLKQYGEKGAWFWALEELMAFDGNLNVASGRSVTSSTMMDLYPQWVRVRVVDGQSTLGMPEDVNLISPSRGYLSDRIKFTDPAIELGQLNKWCVIDLGEPQLINQVRLLPIVSEHYDVVGGRGFPRKFTVQLKDDLDGKPIWETSRGNLLLGYPASCAFTLQVPQVRARFVRLEVDDMWSRDYCYIWGLAELQVYGANRNLAAGRPVMVSDRTDKPADSGWTPEALVDGFTSRYRVLEWPAYLDLIQRRGDLEREMMALARQHEAGLRLGRRVISGSVVGLLLGLVLACVWVFTWQRLVRQRELEQLRQQISRDLHDDIGSNLGGIALLSEIGSQHCPDAAWRKDFASIREAAEQASISMRDIVWLVQREQTGLKDMVRRMREAADMILRLHEVEFSLEPTLFKDRHLTLSFRRHVFFSFKEALNNIRKHAGAKRVRVSIRLDGERLRFEIHDDGKGIGAAQAADGGHGLNNLERRATQLGGSFRIDSKPGEGTLLVFEAPFHH